MREGKKSVESIFSAAVELSSDDERKEFLDNACGDDPDLRSKLKGLIQAHQAANDFLEEPAAKLPVDDLVGNLEVVATIDNQSARSADSTPAVFQIGPYKVLEKIGEGGMGSVYRAQQIEPVNREVALKIIKSGLDSKQVIARFEAERQALAMMDHPNVAKLLDVGTTDDGLPYFVMELVKGISITKYCDRARSNVKQRLELFALVCNAIQHAHQKGIIHRDIKPNNILVTEYDEQVVPKVIDFGLAKALDQNLTDKTVFTQFGQVMGTLAYMSPEQSKINSKDVDTRSDIYSLGVLLYELLTGTTPFDGDSFREIALDQVLRIIREENPPKPSARLSSDHSSGQIAQNRSVFPEKLGRLVRGDLDWIVMKALEKERSRRFETATALAEDVERFLNHEAIIARPPTFGYRLGKFMKKNRGLVAALAMITTSLVAGIAGTAIGWYRTDQALKLADEKNIEVVEKNEEVVKQKGIAEGALQKVSEEKDKSEEALARSNYILASTRWDQGRAKEANDFLDNVPEKYRHFEWHLARRQFLGSDLTLYGHQSYAACIDFSPDDNQIVTGGYDSSIKIWDAISGQELLNLVGQSGLVRSVRFSPDGLRVVSVKSNNFVEIWDAIAGRQIRSFRGNGPVGIAADGSRFATVRSDGHIRVLDSEEFKVLQIIPANKGNLTHIRFSQDAERIVLASVNGSIRIFDVMSGKSLKSIYGYQTPGGGRRAGTLHCLDISPNGAKIVGGNDAIIVWDADSGKTDFVLKGHSDDVLTTQFSSDGAWILSGSRDNSIKVWNAATGEEVKTFVGHTNAVTNVCFSSDGGRIASASMDGTAKVWRRNSSGEMRLVGDSMSNCLGVSPDGNLLASGNAVNHSVDLFDSRTGIRLNSLAGHQKSVTSVSFSPKNNLLASASDDQTVKIWDLKTGQVNRTLAGGNDTLVEFCPTGSRIAVVDRIPRKNIKIFDVGSGELLKELVANSYITSSMNFSADGQLLATTGLNNGRKRTIQVWEVDTGKVIQTLFSESIGGASVCFSPDQEKILAGGLEGRIEVWSTSTWEFLSSFLGHSKPVCQIAFTADSKRIVTGSYDGLIKLWDSNTGQELRTLSSHFTSVNAIFSPDGKWFVTGGKRIKLWGHQTGHEAIALGRHRGAIGCRVFSQDGSLLATGSIDNDVKIWDVEQKCELGTLTGHLGDVIGLDFSPDGSQIASASKDNSIKLWDVKSLQETTTFVGHSRAASIVQFSQDGRRLASASTSGTIKIWDIATRREIKTIEGPEGFVLRLQFDERGNQIYVHSVSGKNVGWDLSSGKQLETSYPNPGMPPQDISRNGRWLATQMNERVLLVDLAFKDRREEKATRESNAKLDANWHRDMARLASRSKNRVAELFHRAWIIEKQPYDQRAIESLQKVYEKLDEEEKSKLTKHFPRRVTRIISIAIENKPQ